MRFDAPPYDVEQLGHAAAADYDAYVHAEHMLRYYGAAYVCQHPEVLFGRLPMSNPEHRVRATHQGLACDPSGIYSRTGPGARLAGEDDLLLRVVGAYQMLDEIFAPHRAPTCAEERSTKSDTSTSTNAGDQP